MASEFSVGVIIGGIVGSSFRSAVSGTRRALDSLGDTSRRLQERQNALTRATERYGQLGSSRMQRLNSDLLRVSRTMEQIERQQRRLSAVSATSDALKSNRMALYGQGAETYGIARTLGAPVMASVKQYSSFESQLRDISVTGDLDSRQEQAIGTAIRRASLQVNQLQESLLGGVGQLVADGMNPQQAATFAGMLGKAATATKADMTDLAKMTYAFSDALKITDAKELEQAFGIAATGAKLGSFELKDMAKALPGMAKAFAARGIYGKDAITQIVASLEVGKGSGSAEEAVTNMSNWLAAMGRGDTTQKYAKAGVDYQGSMQNYVAQGFSQYEASLMIANRFIDGKGKAFVQQWKAAGSRGDQEGQQKLMESFGLAEVFTDIQTVNHLLSMRQGWDKYQSNKQEMNTPSAMATLDKDAAKQNDTLEGRWRRTQIGFNDSAISIGESLRPALIQLGETFIPIMNSVGKWIAANPQLVSGTIQVIGALLAFKMATIGLKLGLNLLISPFVNVWKNAVLLRANWLRLSLALGEGGKLRWLVTGFSAVARGARTLGGVLSGGLVRGIMIAGRAVLWIGRALLMNPIGLAITAVAAAAYLIYRNWGAVSNWFKQRWADIKTAFNGGIVGIGKLLLNWSPVGLLYKAFAGALKYLGIDLPAQFTDFGGHLIDGLVNGIKNKWESVKSTVSDLGDNVGGWFKEKLGIHSPSRVFMGFGDNIAQGASIGIKRTTPAAALAGQQMANQLFPNTPPSIQGPKIIDNTSGFRLGMPSLDTDGLLSSARDKLGGVINSLSSMPAIRLSTAATALPEQRRAGEINQNAYSLPSPDISGLLSFARNAFGELINSLSPMPAMRIPAAAPTLTGQRIANEMTPDVPRIPSPEIMAAGYSGHGAASTGGGTSGGIQVSFNPQFFLNGKETAAPDGLTGALNMSLHELEKMLERLLAQQQRRRYS
ncbi:TPA: phage tail tape measure protein [Enterobacter hormaechei subsp. hoffmannii]|nr:phage tail tape measure protein [Enterobacter hormaechei]HCR9761078.1 phage tail tape measure protein [Citrobacter koseri]AVJ80788.1 phage tail tape measure protein, TP901 family, core region [Enterobacter hormaechei subsp. hoffmannii]MDF9170090.1 phage tail tape measure protein [Enterobacter hormaechei]HCT9930766.1 phage tail tape measure protein [Enterobacter hormaechei]HCW3044690.1 phage tail tape measure protein [Enterobacter hormaechei subsp. hoffmannii]